MVEARHRSSLGLLEAKELSSSTWRDFEKLFERHGGVWGGCWCMYYHLASGWSKRTPKQNKQDKRHLVHQGKSHGVLIYHNRDPMGWCQFGPKEELPRIDAMKNYKLTDQEDLWRITCFFVDRRYRRKGVAKEALRAALSLMKKKGAGMMEAYPIDVTKKRYSSSHMWFGSLELFDKFGFTKVARLGTNHWVVRKQV